MLTAHVNFTYPRGENPVNSPVQHGGGVVGGVIDRGIIDIRKCTSGPQQVLLHSVDNWFITASSL